MKSWIKSCVALLFVALVPHVSAAEYPAKPVMMIVAGPPAGATDNIARILAAEMSRTLGQSMVVDNRAGAGGIIGTNAVLSAAPDGHTLLMGHVAPTSSYQS